MFKKENKHCQMVNVFDTCIDLSYQRNVHTTSVNKIAKAFDWARVGLPKLSYRDGKYYIIDGQHRLAAFKLWCTENMQSPMIECEVLDGLTAAQEATLFAAQNNYRVSISPKDEYKAALAAGDEHNCYVNMSKTFKKYGLVVVNNDATSLGIRCLRAIRRKMELFGSNFIEYYSRIIAKSTIRLDRDAYSQTMCNALAVLFHNNIEADKLIAFFDKNAIKDLILAVQNKAGKLNVKGYELAEYITMCLKA